MINSSSAVSALVGMDGIVVGAQQLVDGEWWLYAETTADVTGCPVVWDPSGWSWPVPEPGSGSPHRRAANRVGVRPPPVALWRADL